MITPKPLFQPLILQNAQTTQYTSPVSGKGTIIDKCTVTNYDSSARTVSINLVTLADTAGDDNLILKLKSLAPGETYTCPEIVGHILAAGDFVSTIASTSTSVTLRMSGRELT